MHSPGQKESRDREAINTKEMGLICASPYLIAGPTVKQARTKPSGGYGEKWNPPRRDLMPKSLRNGPRMVVSTSEATENLGTDEGVRFRTEDEFISFIDLKASRTRSGRELVPDARVVTTNDRIQDLGNWLAQAFSCPEVRNRTLRHFFSPGLAKAGDALSYTDCKRRE